MRKLASGRTTYSLWRRWINLIDSITSFSELPLVGIFYLGLAISVFSAGMAMWLVLRKLFFGRVLEGWVSVMLSVWFLGGLLIFCVGVIGIYVSKIFLETKQRPYTIVRRVHELSAQDRPLRLARPERGQERNEKPVALRSTTTS